MRTRRILLPLVLLIAGLFIAADGGETKSGKPSLDKALAQLKVPPDWFKSVKVNYDLNQPWKEARIEVRRLLALGGEKSREGVKLTYLYVQKQDIGDGHEYPMYLFMSGEYAWAVQEYRQHLRSKPKGYTHEYLSLASCYRHFGEYDKALEVLDLAMQRRPDPPWRIARTADIHDHLGDTYAEMGDFDRAQQHYQQAIELYPTSKQPHGRHLLRRRAAKVQSKLDLLAHQSIESGQLRDGTYKGRSLGYSKDIVVTVKIKKGRITDIQVKHQEKIDLNATSIIPQRIIEKQSLKVDGITGATVTCQSIVEGTFRALRKAGFK